MRKVLSRRRLEMVIAELEGAARQTPCLDNFDGIGSHPDVELVEALLQLDLERAKEVTASICVWRIDENADQLVSVDIVLVCPNTLDCLRFAGNGTEVIA